MSVGAGPVFPNGLNALLRGWHTRVRPQVRCVDAAGAQLGENPRWVAREQRLYWLDLPAGSVHVWEPASGRRRSARLADELGALVRMPDDSLLVGIGDALHPLTPELTLGPRRARIDGLPAQCRLNDGCADAAGRVWLAVMHRAGTEALGGLCRLDPDGSTHWVERGYRIANGPALDAQARCLYLADSPLRTVYRLDLDAAGEVGNRQVFVRFSAADGYPDGLAVDADGTLWIAHYDGGCVSRHAPDGRRLERLWLPVDKVTACAFGAGTLFLTSARAGLDARALRRQPLAGGLFAACRLPAR